MILESELLKKITGITHGFGTRSEPIPKVFLAQWDTQRPTWQQVHGVNAVEVAEPKQSCGEADALYSRQPGIPIAIMTADCVPILLARASGGAVAAVHAGWRGTEARILTFLWDQLRAQGEKPADWVAAIGPAIGPCCYEVSEDLARSFSEKFGKHPGAVPSPRHLDLPAINAAELRSLGMKDVEILRHCTRCSGSDADPTFFSYRREGKGTRQWSGMMIQET